MGRKEVADGLRRYLNWTASPAAGLAGWLVLAGFGSALAWAVFADEQDCALSPTSERRKASLFLSLSRAWWWWW